MLSFSNEISDGTFDLLLSKPLKPFEIILGTFFYQLIILVLAITPTIFYTYYLTHFINSSNYNKIKNIPSQIDIKTAMQRGVKFKFSSSVKSMAVLIEVNSTHYIRIK